MLKSAIRSIFRSAGFELRRLPTGLSSASSMAPFIAQRKLLTDTGPITIFDVGAYQGQTASKYALAFPEAIIYSFEPVPEAFNMLSRYTSNHINIKPFQLAIAESSGSKVFYVNERRDTSSLFPLRRSLNATILQMLKRIRRYM